MGAAFNGLTEQFLHVLGGLHFQMAEILIAGLDQGQVERSSALAARAATTPRGSGCATVLLGETEGGQSVCMPTAYTTLQETEMRPGEADDDFQIGFGMGEVISSAKLATLEEQ